MNGDDCESLTIGSSHWQVRHPRSEQVDCSCSGLGTYDGTYFSRLRTVDYAFPTTTSPLFDRVGLLLKVASWLNTPLSPQIPRKLQEGRRSIRKYPKMSSHKKLALDNIIKEEWVAESFENCLGYMYALKDGSHESHMHDLSND